MKHEKRKGIIRTAVLLFAAVCLLLGLSACSGKKSPAELREEAITLYKEGNYEGALERFEEALSAGRGRASDLQFDIMEYKADCELRTGQYSAARDTYERLMKLDKDKKHLRAYQRVLDSFDRIDELKAACALMDEGKYEEAYRAFDPLAELTGDAAGIIAWYNKAVCAENLGRWDEAYELFRKYVKAMPDDEAAAKEFAFLKQM